MSNIIMMVVKGLMFLLNNESSRELLIDGTKKLLDNAEEKSKTVKKIVEVVNDKDVHEIIVNGAEYLSKKTENTYDDELVKLISKKEFK